MLDEIDLNDTKKTSVRVALCQIELNEEQIAFSGVELDAAVIETVWRRVERTLTEVCQYNPDVIQFPECSIPDALLANLTAFADKRRVIIIAGTHYQSSDEGFVSRCPVIFPDWVVHYTEKITVSPLEKTPMSGKSVIPGTKRLLFKNTRIGNFVVYICADFLEEVAQSEVADLDPDLVFVSAYHPTSSKQYYNELSKACGVGYSGAYCLYSNVQSPKLQSSKGKPKSFSDGGSALFGITDRVYQQSYSEHGLSDLVPEAKVWQASSPNDYVIADLDLTMKKPEVPKRISTSPNIGIVASRSRLGRKRSSTESSQQFKLVAFDMDGTLLRGENYKYSWPKLWELCGDDGTLWRGYMTQYRRGELGYAEWCETAVRYYREAGLCKDLIFQVARDQAYVVSGLSEGIQELRSMGMSTALISGGVDIFMMALLSDYKQLFDHNFVNRLQFDGEDIVCGVDVTPYDYEHKAEALRWLCNQHGFDIEEAIFIGDSYNDVAAMKEAGCGIVFGGNDESVRDISNKIVETDDLRDVVDYIKSIHSPSML